MNIALIIGVSAYLQEDALPACSHDADNMAKLLTATGKYDDITLVNSKTDAASVKEALRSFFGRYQNGSVVNEAFVYFSGHGIYQGDALLCCSDFDAARPASTSISNVELDVLLRSINPTVAVKVFDACQSGSPYIKDASGGFAKALHESKLNSFICMASSRQDQSSFASATESAFTSKWIDAAIAKTEGTIYYRDIQAALADAFVSDPEQTPYFVSQGTGLEVFSIASEQLQKYKSFRLKSVAPARLDDDLATLVQTEIAKRDRAFVPYEKAVDSISESKSDLHNYDIGDTLVRRFYDQVLIADGKLPEIPKRRAVAEFASEQGWSKKYFVKIETESVRVKVARSSLSQHLRFSLIGSDESEFTTETRIRPSYLESTEVLPLEVVKISYTSQHPSLAAYDLVLGVVHSLTDVMVLSAVVQLSQKGWNNKSPELSDVQWRYENFLWMNVVRDPTIVWQAAVVRAESDIRSYLQNFAPVPASSGNDEAKLSDGKSGEFEVSSDGGN